MIPNYIDKYTTFLRRSIPDDGILLHHHGFIKNIGYCFQYLEYLDDLLKDDTLHAVVKVHSQKSFIISAMGVVEAILWYVLKSNGQQSKQEWVELKFLIGNTFSDNETTRRINTQIEEKLPEPKDADMSLDVMRKKVEAKELLGVDRQVYRDLNHLRGLRNRVHIHAVDSDQDTDWYRIGKTEVNLMKDALHSILSSSVFQQSKELLSLFDYLKKEE